MEKILFDDRKWFEKIEVSFFSYRVVREYIDYESSLSEFIDAETYLHTEYEVDNAILNVKSVHVYQAIALFCSYIEEIFKDCVFVILEKKPSLQKDFFLNKDVFEGYDSKKRIENYSRMPIEGKLKWLDSLSKREMSLECKIEIKKLFKLKNKIVSRNTHNTEDLEVAIDYYYNILGKMFIENLGGICDAMKIDRTNKEYEEVEASGSRENSNGTASNIIRFPPKV